MSISEIAVWIAAFAIVVFIYLYRRQHVVPVGAVSTSTSLAIVPTPSIWKKMWTVLEYCISTPFVFLRLAVVIMAALIPVMWLSVAYLDWTFIVYFLFVISTPLMVIFVLRWQWFAIALGLGAFVAWLQSTESKSNDLTVGGAKGVVTLYRITLGVLTAFWVIAGVLIVFPWAQHPAAFWTIFMGAMIVVGYSEARQIRLMWVRDALIMGFGALVIGYGIWTMIPPTWKGYMFDSNGNALVMMEPEDSPLYPKVYDGITVASCANKTCGSPHTKKQLVPVTPEVSMMLKANKIRKSLVPKAEDHYPPIFNLDTGEPLFVMEAEDSPLYPKAYRNLSVAECRARANGCISKYSGEKLVPITYEAAKLLGLVPPTQAELEAQKKAKAGAVSSGAGQTTAVKKPATKAGFRPAQPTVGQVFRSGSTTAPVAKYVWERVPEHLCIYWYGRDPEGDNFATKYKDPSGQEKDYTGQPLEDMRAVGFMSTSGQPEPVNYDLLLKQQGKCPTATA